MYGRMRKRVDVGSKAKIGSLTHTILKTLSTTKATRDEINVKHCGFSRPGYMTAVYSDLVHAGLTTSSRKGYEITDYGRTVLADIEARN
jgi:hypothetical protein